MGFYLFETKKQKIKKSFWFKTAAMSRLYKAKRQALD